MRARINGTAAWVAGAAVTSVCVVALVLTSSEPREPAYHGRTLTAWLKAIQASGPPLNDFAMQIRAKESIRQIGTNALPCLRRLVMRHDSGLKLAIVHRLQRQRYISHSFELADWNRSLGIIGYSALGPLAKGDIPILSEAVTNDSLASVRQSAVRAIGGIGPQAKSAIPVIVRATKDANASVRTSAFSALGHLHPNIEIVIDTFITGLQDVHSRTRESAATALAQYGPEAKKAVPVLVQTLKTNLSAAIALQYIDPEASERIVKE